MSKRIGMWLTGICLAIIVAAGCGGPPTATPAADEMDMEMEAMEVEMPAELE